MIRKKKKVLWLPKWYPNKLDVLDGVFIVDHAKAVASNVDLCLLFVHSDLKLKKRVEVERSTQGNFLEFKVYFKHKSIGLNSIDKLLIAVKYVIVQFWFSFKIKKEWGKADVTHVHCLARTSLLALYLKFVQGTPFFVTEHWSGFDPNSNYNTSNLKKSYIRWLLKYSSGVTAVSNYLKAHLETYVSASKLRLLSNTVDEKMFRPFDKNIERDKVSFIHVSTLDDYPKNFGNIIRATADLYKHTKNFELVVYGKGVEKEKQMKLAKDLGVLNEVVFFKGFASKERIAEAMREADVFLLFSWIETQSCVAIEALLSGIPAIVPDVGGVKELVNETNGVKINPNNKQMLTEVMMRFINGEYAFSSELIREQALQYGYASIGREIEKMYLEEI